MFSKQERQRYDRHFILPEVGLQGQQRLKQAKVLVVGCGGLGSPVLLYLAAAGVGTLGLVDFDVVSESNLQRQVIFGSENVGEPKVLAAQQRLQSLNPYTHTQVFKERITVHNAAALVADYDVVVDCTDNFPTRYLLNDVCFLAGKPLVYGAILRFEGQVSVFNGRNAEGGSTPNYRDLYPTPPPPEMVPNCAESGVLGVLPGIIGSMQAAEVLKMVAGAGKPLYGRMFVFDALTFESRTFIYKRRNDNPLYSEQPDLVQTIDYELFCGFKSNKNTHQSITPQQLRAWQTEGRAFQLIDVREPEEYALRNIGALLIPLAQLSDRVGEIAKDRPVVVHCKTGGRSAKAVETLTAAFGFSNVYDLVGGIEAL
jgi:sulfur-carrier protein adenylyltransferase/sulfurtransferase